MRKLSAEEIGKIAAHQGVRKVAVENFLGTMGDDSDVAYGNLELDAKLYKWNAPTENAILIGIELAGLEKMPGEDGGPTGYKGKK